MDSKNMLNNLVDSHIFGIYIYQKEAGRIVFANKRFSDMLGYKQEELIGKSLFDIYQIRETRLKRCVKKHLISVPGAGEHLSFYLKSKTGSAVYAEEFIYNIDYEGKPAGFAVVIDRTKEKAYELFYKSLSKVIRLTANIDDEHILLQSVCDILVNRFGFTAATAGKINKKTKLFNLEICVSKNQRLSETMKKLTISVDPSLKEGKGTVSVAYNTKKIALSYDVIQDERMAAWRKYQKEFDIYSVCSIPILKNNETAYVLIIYADIKDMFSEDNLSLLEKFQFHLSFALNNIERRKNIITLEKAVKTTHEWVITTDKDGNIIYANKSVMSISGYNKDELIGQNPRVFKSGAHSTEFYKNLWGTITTGKTWSGRFQNKAKDGSIFYLDAIITPVERNGEVYRFVDLSRDVTDQVYLQQNLELQSKLYNTLYQLTNLLIKAEDENEFLDKLTRLFIDFAGFDMAYMLDLDLQIKTKQAKEHKNLSLTNKVITIFKNLLSKQKADFVPFYKTLKNKKVYIINDLKRFERTAFGTLIEQHNLASCCSVPVIKNGTVVGVMILISFQKNIFDANLYRLLKIISGQIEHILNEIENKKFLNIITKSLDTGFDAVMIMDKNFNVVYTNDIQEKKFGFSRQELIDVHKSVFHSGRHIKAFGGRLYETITKGDVFSGIVTYKTKDGKTRVFLMAITPYKIDNSIEYYIGIGKEIEQNKTLLNKLDYVIRYDSLTGLLNANELIDSVERFLIRAKQAKQMGAVAVINPVSFKRINEAFGFETGNKLLKLIAKRLKQTVFEHDVLVKLESDRFGIVLKDLKDEESVVNIALKLLLNLKKPYRIGNNTISLPFNIGLSIYPKDAETPHELLDKAQVALADAKSKGENQIGFFREEFEPKIGKKVMESVLKARNKAMK